MKISGLGLFTFIIALTILSIGDTLGQDSKLVVRLARLKIDPTQLENYKTALKEEIETSIRVEPGVLTLNAVADKNNPTDITILEIYLNEDSYRKHLETPHFKKYKTTTKDMVKSLELMETTPILLGTKVNNKTD
ncbi:MAG: antibiotic biosynthesis monooxygenase [Cytophagales bacterium]|jgi:quinol monooxygenase YgiN|nr:antibiotic biosynthesis monooxygenase [Cytophagales bacterium]MCA6414506.1 antibiotic biosynthesis monooxygenase [Cytophagales bacterium]MCA6420004.1 antibiotic biosynthesis monooxygenase [Cytophagales bacterium]MCA6427243.1 antibiotic biosynthesis monooxygenase [Cytophagales bacterium]MCA6430888.1 antibiotic biosynthesis monooxygenase [Cytophagales bacterium]